MVVFFLFVEVIKEGADYAECYDCAIEIEPC